MDVIYQKIWADLWGNKARTIQVALIVALSSVSIGLVIGGRNLAIGAVADDWQTADPPAIKLNVSPAMSDEQLAGLKNIDNIVEVEGLLSAPIEWRLNPDDEWQTAMLYARDDYLNQKMSKEYLVSGEWPVRNLFGIARGFDTYFGLNEGDQIWTRINGRERTIAIGGTINRVGSSPTFSGTLMLFTTRARFGKFFGSPSYNTIQMGIGDFDQSVADAADAEIKTRLAKLDIDSQGGIAPDNNRIVPPDVPPAANILNTVFTIMAVVGGVIVILGIFLVYNSVSAIITQQVDQIGVMKAIGASTGQVLRGYLLLILAYGLLATLIAIPGGLLAAYGIKMFFVNLINLSDSSFQIDPVSLMAQIAVALLAPLAASLSPVMSGVRITVREAISTYGITGSAGLIDNLVARLKNIPYTILLTIGNTFRNMRRVLLTQTVLVGSGLIFMVVLGLYDSNQYTFLNELQSIHRYQATLAFEQPERIRNIEQVVANQAGVINLEAWTTASATVRPATQRRAFVDDEQATLLGQPSDTMLYTPKMEEGRWLQPGDENVAVFNKVLAEKADVSVGDQVIFTFNSDKESTWEVVGILFDPAIDDAVHMPQPALAQAVGDLNKANSVWIQTDVTEPDAVKAFVLALKATFEAVNMPVATDTIFRENTITEISADKLSGYDLIVSLLSLMAAVIAVVGGIGLSGVLSLSVMERTREIGIMRAIGASSGRVSGLFIGEGLILGILSWLIALPLSIPVAYLFSTWIIPLTLGNELVYHFTWVGPTMWMGIICLLAIVASWIPARSATQVSVRESLMYQ